MVGNTKEFENRVIARSRLNQCCDLTPQPRTSALREHQLHLVYEDLKLNVLTASEHCLRPLVTLLSLLARELPPPPPLLPPLPPPPPPVPPSRSLQNVP